MQGDHDITDLRRIPIVRQQLDVTLLGAVDRGTKGDIRRLRGRTGCGQQKKDGQRVQQRFHYETYSVRGNEGDLLSKVRHCGGDRLQKRRFINKHAAAQVRCSALFALANLLRHARRVRIYNNPRRQSCQRHLLCARTFDRRIHTGVDRVLLAIARE